MSDGGEAFPPRRVVGAPVRSLDLTGMLLAFADGQPVLLRMPESEQLYLPCFGTIADLLEVLGRVGAAHDRIKKIDDGPEFVTSIPPSVEVILNVRWKGSRIRFTQVLRG